MGTVFALNIRSAAQRLAASVRPYPWWVKWPLTDDPAGYRVMGLVFAITGMLLVAAAAR